MRLAGHFRELLEVYARVARGDDHLAIAHVISDVTRMQAALRPLAGASGAAVATEAHELYRVRELAETPLYVYAA